MSTNPAIITVVGSLNVDLVTRTARVPAAGETLTSESFSTGFGGKGANQAVACARLSRTQKQAAEGTASDVEVRMVGAVGDDQFGAGFIEQLQKDGLKTDGIKVLEGKKTGVAVIVVETGTGENRIMFCPGANYDVEVADLVGNDGGVALFQLELPMDVVSFPFSRFANYVTYWWSDGYMQVVHNMKAARAKGIETIINPAPAIQLPAEAYEGLNHLIVNETEASIMSGIENPTSWDKVAAVFVSRGVKNVIITLGGEVSSNFVMHMGSNVSNLALPGRVLPNAQATGTVATRTVGPSTQSQSRGYDGCW